MKTRIAFHPWEDIWEELEARGWKKSDFAYVIWIKPSNLTAIIKGERNITPLLAVRIWEAFWTSADVWMKMQTNYDLLMAEKKETERIQEVHKKMKELWMDEFVADEEVKQLEPVYVK